MSRHDRTLRAIFAEPTRANITWDQLRSLLVSLGAILDETREGSRVYILLDGVRRMFHKPHPRKEIGKKTVADARELLADAGIRPRP